MYAAARLGLLFFICFIGSIQLLPASVDSSQGQPSDIELGLEAVGHTLTSPLRWESRDMLLAGAVTLGSAVSFLLDDEVQSEFRRGQSSLGDALEPIGFVYGSPFTMAPVALLSYCGGAIAGNDWIQKTGLMMSEALLVIAVVQIPTSMISGRARPITGEDNRSFALLDGWESERKSFFSGHSAVAFAISTVLAHQIESVWASVALYGLAGLTPLARLYVDDHWFSDTVLGTALGLAIGHSIVKFHADRDNKENKLSIVPAPGGLRIAWNL